MNPTKEVAAAPQETSEELAKYELMMILMPDMSQEETDKHLNRIRKQIKDLKGEIYHEDIWDIRDLAYMIKKQDKGYYVIFYFTFPGQNIVELEKEFLLDQKLLRHMFVKSPKGYEIKKLSDFELTEEDYKRKPREDKKPVRRVVIAKPKAKIEEKAAEETPKEEVAKEDSKAEKVEEKAPAKEKAEEKVAEEAPAEEKVEEKAEEKKTMDISDLDSKLETILDDPDINIKL